MSTGGSPDAHGVKISPQPWRWSHPRVLVEDPDAASGLATASGLRFAGYAVAVCPGPRGHGQCPLTGPAGCAPAHDADLVVCLLGYEREVAREVLRELRTRYPDTPLLVSVPSEIDAQLRALLDGCHQLPVEATPEQVVAAVQRLSQGLAETGAARASPFQSEPEAFRLLLLVITGLIPVAVAATLGPAWLALVVLGVVASGLGARAAQLRARRLRHPDLQVRMAPAHVGAAAERRVLIVANDTLGEETLLGEVRRLAALPHTHVPLLVPALVGPGARLTGAIDDARARARARLGVALARAGRGPAVAGTVSEEDPLAAIEDAFATFVPDEVIVATRREPTAGRLEPWLAGLARERFAVPVHHLVFEPGAPAQEPDEATWERYRRAFGDEAARSFARRALALTGIVVALVMALAALINDAERQTASATPQLKLTQATALPPGAASAPAKVLALKVIPEGRRGPEGKLHDDFTVTEFHVTVGQPLTLRIDNTDTVPHSISSPKAGVNIVAQPGTHSYTLLVQRPGKFEWHCMSPCDPWSMEHVGYMRGFIVATPS